MAEYIEREALLKELAKDVAVDGNQRAAQILECIINAPAADVAPVVHGRWIIKHDGPYGRRRCYCSACREHSGIGGIASNQKKPFCPNCGARMDGGEEDA